jgi:hypothetical protein
VVEDSSENKDWDEFRNKLVNATSKNKMGKVSKGPRYAVYDFEYDLASGEGSRSELYRDTWQDIRSLTVLQKQDYVHCMVSR